MLRSLCAKKKIGLFIPFLTNKLQLIEVFVELSKVVVVVASSAASAVDSSGCFVPIKRCFCQKKIITHHEKKGVVEKRCQIK